MAIKNTHSGYYNNHPLTGKAIGEGISSNNTDFEPRKTVHTPIEKPLRQSPLGEITVTQKLNPRPPHSVNYRSLIPLCSPVWDVLTLKLFNTALPTRSDSTNDAQSNINVIYTPLAGHEGFGYTKRQTVLPQTDGEFTLTEATQYLGDKSKSLTPTRFKHAEKRGVDARQLLSFMRVKSWCATDNPTLNSMMTQNLPSAAPTEHRIQPETGILKPKPVYNPPVQAPSQPLWRMPGLAVLLQLLPGLNKPSGDLQSTLEVKFTPKKDQHGTQGFGYAKRVTTVDQPDGLLTLVDTAESLAEQQSKPSKQKLPTAAVDDAFDVKKVLSSKQETLWHRKPN